MIKVFEDINEIFLKQLTSEYNVINVDNFLNTLVSQNFPFGFKNIPDDIVLLKILYLKNKYDFDTTRLGPYYIANEGDIENMKGMLDAAEYEGEPFLVRIKTKKENIDVEETLRTNLLYQFEYSTVLKPNSEISVINIERL